MRRVVLALSVVASVGCGSPADPPGGNGDGDGGPDVRSDAAYGASHVLTWGPITVPPATENTQCVVKRLDNDGTIKVGRIVNDLGLGSHHLIVYRLADGPERTEPFDCDPFVEVLDPTAGAPLAVTQSAAETITLPPGVAFSLTAGQLVRLEIHYINAGLEPIEIGATTTFIEIPEADFRDEADFLFVGNPDIAIPKHEQRTVGPSFLPLPPELTNINVFAITGHQHRFGTGVEIARTDGPDAERVSVYDPPTFRWNEPPTIYHDPPFTMAPGGGFEFTCHFNNTSESDVGFGESATDEMCFFWAYYYPSNGAKVCFHTAQRGGIDICCPGGGLCSLLEDYLRDR
jgi:hypothetical protein